MDALRCPPAFLDPPDQGPLGDHLLYAGVVDHQVPAIAIRCRGLHTMEQQEALILHGLHISCEVRLTVPVTRFAVPWVDVAILGLLNLRDD